MDISQDNPATSQPDGNTMTPRSEIAILNAQLTTSPPTASSSPTAPDGGYGWVCVACSTVINAHTWGAIGASYGVFLSHYLSHNTFKGTSQITYAFIGGLILSQAVVIAPLATYLVQVFGNRACLFFGNFWLTLGLVTASFASKGWQIVLSEGICSGWGM